MTKIIFFISLIIVIIFIKNIFNVKENHFSALEVDRNLTRQEYLGNSLGKFYGNRFGVIYFKNIYPRIMKIEGNIFRDLGKIYVYLPIFLLLICVGYIKHNDKNKK